MIYKYANQLTLLDNIYTPWWKFQKLRNIKIQLVFYHPLPIDSPEYPQQNPFSVYDGRQYV